MDVRAGVAGARSGRPRPRSRPIGWAAFVVALGGACLAGGPLGGPAVLAQPEGSWSSVQGGPSHPGSLVDARLDPPRVREWMVEVNGDPRLSSPAVVSGIGVAVGPDRVVGFDPESGEIAWEADRVHGFVDPPAISPDSAGGGTVVFGEGSSAEDDAIVAIDLADQNVLWRADLEGVPRGAPAIDGDMVLTGTGDGFVHALDVETGEERWAFETEGRVHTAPAAAGGLVFAVSENLSTGVSRLYAIDEESGEEAWRFEPPGVSIDVSGPAVSDGRVYVGFGDLTVRSIEAGTGTVLWEGAVRGVFSPLSLPAVAEGDLYIADRSGSLYRFDGATGSRRWDFQFPSEVLRGSPLVVGSFVYVGLEDGTLAAIDVETGELRWRTAFEGAGVAHLVPAGDLLLVPTVGPAADGPSAGGLWALRSDPGGALVREPSPTKLDLPAALLSFMAASVALLLGLLGFFRLLEQLRRRRPLPQGSEASRGRG